MARMLDSVFGSVLPKALRAGKSFQGSAIGFSAKERVTLSWFALGFFAGIVGTSITLGVFAANATAHSAARPSSVASSMKWYEQEVIHNMVCRPSPVNRISRPQSCMGFETSFTRFAVLDSFSHLYDSQNS